MLSKLATIQTIKALTPTVGAEMTEMVTFEDMGRKYLTKKSEFQVFKLILNKYLLKQE